jgi:hypothetical protein
MANYLATLDRPIEISARSESSGTTSIFSSCLSSFYPAWTQRFPATFDLWTKTSNLSAISQSPNFHLIEQNFGVAGFVAATPYSLGYVAYPTIARETIFTLANMINANGDEVSANPPNLLPGLTNPSISETFAFTDLINPPLPNAWPMAGATYVMIRSGSNSTASCLRRRELLLFFHWALTATEPQDRVMFDGYSSLGTAINEKVLEKLESIQCPKEASDSSDFKTTLLGFQPLAQHTPLHGYKAVLGVTMVLGIAVLFLVGFYLIRDRGSIPAPAFFFFGALGVGTLLNCLGIIWFYLVPSSVWICQLRQWFIATGFSLMYAGIFVRAHQISTIHKLSKSFKIKIKTGSQLRNLVVLISTFGAIFLAQLVILTLWSSIDTFKPSQSNIDSLRRTFTYVCASKNSWVWFGLEIAYFAILLSFGLFVVYRTWDMKHLVVESKWIAISIYNSIVVLGIVLALLTTLPTNDNSIFYVSVGAIAFLTITITLAIFLPKVLRNGLADSTGSVGSTMTNIHSSKRTNSKTNSKSKSNVSVDSIKQ